MSSQRFHDRVALSIAEDIAHVRLSRPDKHNGMDFPMLDAVFEASHWLRRNRDVRAVILSGEGPSFCAGLDVQSVMKQPGKAALGYARLWQPFRNRFQAWSMAWRELPMPVIAVVHGNCFGAGIQLALGADIRVARPDARLSVMESKWGLVPDMGGGALLRELVGIDVAKELCFTGRVIDGREAQALGLVTHVDESPEHRATALAREIAARSPDAVAAAKFLLQQAWDGDEHEALAAERRWQRRVMGGRNQRLAVKRNSRDAADDQASEFAPRSIGPE